MRNPLWLPSNAPFGTLQLELIGVAVILHVMVGEDRFRVRIANHEVRKFDPLHGTGADTTARSGRDLHFEFGPFVKPPHGAHPLLAVRYHHGGHDDLDAFIECRSPDSGAAAPTCPINADTIGINAGNRLQISDGVINVLSLLEWIGPPTFSLAVAEAAMIDSQDEITFTPKPLRHIEPVHVFHARIAMQHDDGWTRRHTGLPVFGRVQI